MPWYRWAICVGVILSFVVCYYLIVRWFRAPLDPEQERIWQAIEREAWQRGMEEGPINRKRKE